MENIRVQQSYGKPSTQTETLLWLFTFLYKKAHKNTQFFQKNYVFLWDYCFAPNLNYSNFQLNIYFFVNNRALQVLC